MADKRNRNDQYFLGFRNLDAKGGLGGFYVNKDDQVEFQSPQSVIELMQTHDKMKDTPFGKEAVNKFISAYNKAQLATYSSSVDRSEQVLESQEVVTWQMQEALEEMEDNIKDFIRDRRKNSDSSGKNKAVVDGKLVDEGDFLNSYATTFSEKFVGEMKKFAPRFKPAALKDMEKEAENDRKLDFEETYELTKEKAEKLNSINEDVAVFEESEDKKVAQLAKTYKAQKATLDTFLENGDALWGRVGAVQMMQSMEGTLQKLADQAVPDDERGQLEHRLKYHTHLLEILGTTQSGPFLKTGEVEIEGGGFKNGSMSDKIVDSFKSTNFTGGQKSIVDLLGDESAMEKQFEDGVKKEGMEAVRAFNQAYEGFQLATKRENRREAWSQPVADAAVQQMRLSLSKIEENMGTLAPDKGLVGGVLAYQKNVLKAGDPTGSLDKAPANSADTTMKPEATPPAKMVEDKITLDPTKKEELLRDLRATFDDMREVKITRYGETFAFDKLITGEDINIPKAGNNKNGIANNKNADLQKEAETYRDSVRMLNDGLEKGNLSQSVIALDKINNALDAFSTKSGISVFNDAAAEMLRYSKEMSRMIGEATGMKMSSAPEYAPENKEELLKNLGENLNAMRKIQITRDGNSESFDKFLTDDVANNNRAKLKREGIDYRKATTELDKALESGDLSQAAGALETINKSLEKFNKDSPLDEIKESAGKMLEITKKMYDSIEKTKTPQSREQEGNEQSSASGLPNDVRQAAMDAARPAISSFAGVNAGRSDNRELPQLVDRSEAFTRNKFS